MFRRKYRIVELCKFPLGVHYIIQMRFLFIWWTFSDHLPKPHEVKPRVFKWKGEAEEYLEQHIKRNKRGASGKAIMKIVKTL